MKIAILRERSDGEQRVAATPETVAKLIGFGAEVSVEKGAGVGSRIPDKAFEEAGAKLAASAATAVKGAEVVLAVRRPAAASLKGAAKGALVLASMDPYEHEADVAALGKAGVSAFAMEFMPRITRAQVMDVLSSQANLAGYQAVIEAAAHFDRAMPMMMTAAGTVRPAKVFVMGAGVAGLQAIATAKRLGAVVSATDVRAAAGEQVESLGAKFIMTEALKDASGTGGYARELTKQEQAAQAELVAGHIAKQDIVITTALIPGRPAPKLVSKAMVESMAPGSVLVDLAAERGGNVELTKPGSVVNHNDVSIVGFTNMQGRIATTASQLYARNLVAFLETMIDKDEKKLSVDWEDELVKATLLTREGAVVHANFAGAAGTNTASRRKPAARSSAAKTPAAKKPGTRSTAAKSAASKSAAKSSSAKSSSAKSSSAKSSATKSAATKSAAAKGNTRQPAAKTTKPRAANKSAPGKSSPAAAKGEAAKPASDKSGDA